MAQSHLETWRSELQYSNPIRLAVVRTLLLARGGSEFIPQPMMMCNTDSMMSFSDISTAPASDNPDLYREMQGRTFTSKNQTYSLPADEDEHLRLDMQHYAYTLTADSLYPFPDLVKPHLQQGFPEPTRILDVGTGSGRWAFEMAASYPWVRALGVDLVPPTLTRREKIPENCRFEIQDIDEPPEQYAETFSIVHARSVAVGLKKPGLFLDNMAKILKKGGMLLLGIAESQPFDEDKKPFSWVEPGQPGFSWLMYLLGHIYHAYWNRGAGGMSSALWWKEWLEADPNFKDVRTEEVYIPLGPWKEGLSEREKLASKMLRESVINVLTNFRPLLLGHGYTDAEITLWTEQSEKEVREMSPRAYFRVSWTGAVRSSQDYQKWEGMPPNVDKDFLSQRNLMEGCDVRKPWVRPS